jgi:hypothetical protein
VSIESDRRQSAGAIDKVAMVVLVVLRGSLVAGNEQIYPSVSVQVSEDRGQVVFESGRIVDSLDLSHIFKVSVTQVAINRRSRS